jgi:hypothetical protein
MALNRDLMQSSDTDEFTREIEKRLLEKRENRRPFAAFLEEKMDRFDYSNTSLAKKVFRRSAGKDGIVSYVPVTRQAIGSWLKGSMPSAREVYVSLGMAFEMDLDEINHILLETYMGYGLYCKNIEDALWIALINGLFTIHEMEGVRENVEQILAQAADEGSRSLATTDLWVMMAEAQTLEEFYRIIEGYREEFQEGTSQFGRCLQEVIEEEYGYYEKASWFLRDIGCLHCEAQFSKIRAGKAIVTREWLLRFCIALQPSYESVEKLLAKAQMEPLGITPVEVIIEMICRYKSSSLANTQEMWILIETVTDHLRKIGYDIEEELCRKYHSVYEMPTHQKWWLSICIGRQIRLNQKGRDYVYEKNGYCRYASVDRVLFDDVNRLRKNSRFKECSLMFGTGAYDPEDQTAFSEFPSLAVDRKETSDIVEMEKFADYCYMRKPSRFSQDFLMNDIYYYSALLYTIWTGKCFRKDEVEDSLAQFAGELALAGIPGEGLARLVALNLKDDAVYDKESTIPELLKELERIGGKTE